ncbi:MAG: hypothetical protein LBH88_02685, partial [Candidatus Methanoplasma sp.]|nr:hypothetical protein [Candidatus Methanoplasma sp.]
RTFIGWDITFNNVTSDLTVRAMYDVVTLTSGEGGWALLNLIFALIGIIIAVAAVICRARKDDGGDDGTSEQKSVYYPRSFAWLAVSVAVAVAGIVFFLITEDMREPMVFVDKWTIINAILFIIAVVAAVLAFRRYVYYGVFVQAFSSIAGKDKAQRGSAYTFTVEGGYSGAVSYRIGDGGEWKLVFRNDDGSYVIPGGEVTDNIYLETRP